jgi:ankyrin repeat protein
MWDGNAHLSADEKALIKAAKETGDAADVRRLLAAGVGVDTRDGHNMPADQTPLMLAARNAFLEIVRVLLDAGASVSAADKRQGEVEGEHQALHYAVVGQNRAVVEAILDAGADVNALTSGGDTPLNFAIRRGNLELMQLLVERGAAVVKFGRKRYQPPLLAVAGADVPPAAKPALIEFLLKAGADPNASDHRGNTALHRLAGGHDVDDPGRLASLAALLQAGAKDLPDRDGYTALYTAVGYNNVAAAKLLLDTDAGGSNINRVATRGTVLDVAEQNLALAKENRPDRAPAIQSFIDLLISRGGRRKAEMSVDESAAANGAGVAIPSATTATTATKSAKSTSGVKDPPLGGKHFLKLASDGEAEWSLFAIQAPVEQVTEALSRRYKDARVLRGVELKSARKNDELARYMAVVRVKDNAWSVVQRSLYAARESDVDATVNDAKALSEELKTRAISFYANDTSGAVQFDLFEKGALLERVQWVDGGYFSIFESTRRKQPKLNEVDGKFADKTFRELGVYLPACYPRGKGRSACLCVERSSAERIESADLLGLG